MTTPSMSHSLDTPLPHPPASATAASAAEAEAEAEAAPPSTTDDTTTTTTTTTASAAPSSTSASSSSCSASSSSAAAGKRPVVLHIGDAIRYNPAQYARFAAAYEVVRPAAAERARDEFARALRERRWGDFSAVFRPAWGSGGEMGRWDAELVPLLPRSVRVFASAGAGFDWADVDVLAAHGITYCNSASASSEAVADFALVLILSTFRALPWCVRAAASRDPRAFADCHARAPLASRNPRGSVLGVVGLGSVGLLVARKARLALGARILYHDRKRKPPAVEAELLRQDGAGAGAGAGGAADGGVWAAGGLAELLARADCVVLCTPAMPGGARLLDGAALARCKPGARVVNVARGSLVDEEALADALAGGRLSAAALDVHAEEPRVSPRLAAMDNVLLTCHNAGGTLETHQGFEALAMRNIEEVLSGREPLTPVNRHLVVERPA